ncbi:unnamed protein product [Penicillium salamii]|nr:unnamed protein product [Penicillium salamii]CAG8261180.1 unnamed protein product [Penicillium salamii]
MVAASKMSATVGVPVPVDYEPAHLEMLLFRYIETLEIHHASRVLSRWPPTSPPGEYAAQVLRELPSNYFQQPRLLPTGPRFVFTVNGLALCRVDKALPMQILHRESTTGFVGRELAGTVLPAPVAQRRLRPLNSFMIFRSFCSPLFPNIPQKVKSIVISQMWEDDTLKSQWAILAKAYTVLRDHFLVRKPCLKGFVEICVPLIGLANAQGYLDLCGWKIYSEDNSMNLVKIGNSTLSSVFLPNPLSVKEVVENCLEAGFAEARDEEWPKHILECGTVFAVEQSYQGTVYEPQNWVRKDVPQWPMEEFDVHEMYSQVDGDGLPVVCDPSDFAFDDDADIFPGDNAPDAPFNVDSEFLDEVETSTQQY